MPRFEILADEPLAVHAGEPLASMFTLSPFVLAASDGFDILLRAVNDADDPADKVARIYHGTSSDGLHFAMDAEPAIAPGPAREDRDGCEDPTVVTVDGERFVYYSGWNQADRRGELLWASGHSFESLHKQGVALPSTPAIRNPKEASVNRAARGWQLLFEFAKDGASRIGVAGATAPKGPWTRGAIDFAPRAQGWDSWHLSPGPIVERADSNDVFFYNGADRSAAWRIGWATLEPGTVTVSQRCEDALITPPPVSDGSSDIAFAASAVATGDEIWLYYSLSDKQMRRARLRDGAASA